MEKVIIESTIDKLTRNIEISKEKKQELIDKYSSMSDVEIIKDLSTIVYRTFSSNEEYLNNALALIRNLNPDICPETERMKEILVDMFSNNIEGNMSLEDNHKLVSKEIIRYTSLLNKFGIDYYLVGALPCFIKAGEPLFRYHDDIDIMINEDDILKLSQIIGLLGYQFQDDRFPTEERFREMELNKPPHTVLAQNPNNEFHIGFFCFRREQDNSITMREYTHRLENGIVVTDVLERISDSIGTSLRYDDEPTKYKGTFFRTSSIENVYNLKSYTRRPKDISDNEILGRYVNKEVLSQLSNHKIQNVVIQNVSSAEMTGQYHNL